MPFKGVDAMDVKKEFVLKSLDDRVVFTELCRVDFTPIGAHS
jgi:hypothetical protein